MGLYLSTLAIHEISLCFTQGGTFSPNPSYKRVDSERSRIIGSLCGREEGGLERDALIPWASERDHIYTTLHTEATEARGIPCATEATEAWGIACASILPISQPGNQGSDNHCPLQTLGSQCQSITNGLWALVSFLRDHMTHRSSQI